MTQIKSEAQRKKFLKLVKEGKMAKETFEALDKAVDRKLLPPRLAAKVEKPLKIGRVKVIK